MLLSSEIGSKLNLEKNVSTIYKNEYSQLNGISRTRTSGAKEKINTNKTFVHSNITYNPY